MKYPMLKNFLIFRRKDRDTYLVYDALEESEFLMGRKVAGFARKLDGKTDPYTVDPALSRGEVDEYLRMLDQNDLLRYNKVLMRSWGSFYRTLWIPKRSRGVCCVAIVCNAILKFLWLPVFGAGVFLYGRNFALANTIPVTIGCLVGGVTGMVLHEIGHAFATLAYGGRFFEMGVLIRNFMPGAYVLIHSENVKGKWKQIQIMGAGMEMNMMLAGVYLMFAGHCPENSAVFLFAAYINLLLVLVNLMFVSGFDGAAIISELLGADDIVEQTKKALFNRKRRKQLLAQGVNGYAVVTVSIIVQIIQLAMPLMIGMNILEVILWAI